jgi:hypothetical protein
MTLSELNKAIDVALKTLRVNKLCYIGEDDEAYYMTGCGDNGEPLYTGCCCRVVKATLRGEICHHTSPYLETPKKKLKPPEDKKDVFMELNWMPYGG